MHSDDDVVVGNLPEASRRLVLVKGVVVRIPTQCSQNSASKFRSSKVGVGPVPCLF